jgi:hypothetical protein
MPDLSLSEWSDLAQVLATLIGFTGVIVSIWLSVRALKEVERDRKLRHKPYLAFVQGGHRLPVKFVRGGPFVPGVNRAYAEKVLGHLPADGESVVIAHPDQEGRLKPILYGHLKNYGTGPALSTAVTWKPKQIWIGSESFAIDERKQQEPLYSCELNEMPAIPSHIEPGAEARLSRLPAFIVKDYERKITRVDGELVIECRDIFGHRHRAIQEFYSFAEYREQPPGFHVTFSDLVDVEPKDAA